MDDDDIVEIRDAPVVHREEPPRSDEPLLDRGTKAALVVFVFAFAVAVAAIVIAVAYH